MRDGMPAEGPESGNTNSQEEPDGSLTLIYRFAGPITEVPTEQQFNPSYLTRFVDRGVVQILRSQVQGDPEVGGLIIMVGVTVLEMTIMLMRAPTKAEQAQLDAVIESACNYVRHHSQTGLRIFPEARKTAGVKLVFRVA